MDIRVKRIVKDAIRHMDLPFKYSFTYYDELAEEWTEGLFGRVVYVDFTLSPKELPCLETSYSTSIYFYFPKKYPFEPPMILFEDGLKHPFIDDCDLKLCGYNQNMTFQQLIMNAYCIILEAYAHPDNRALVDNINKELEEVTKISKELEEATNINKELEEITNINKELEEVTNINN